MTKKKEEEKNTSCVLLLLNDLGLFVAAKLWINALVYRGTLVLKSQVFQQQQQIKTPRRLEHPLLSDVLFVFCLLFCKRLHVYCSVNLKHTGFISDYQFHKLHVKQAIIFILCSAWAPPYSHLTPHQFQPVSPEMVTDNLSAHLKSNYEFIVVSSLKSQSHKSFLSSALSLIKLNGNCLVQMIIKENWTDDVMI